MSGGASIDIRELIEYKQKWEKFQKDQDKIIRRVLTDLALRAIRLIIFNTPVDQGTLRMGWITNTEKEAYARRTQSISDEMIKASMKIERMGDKYFVSIENVVSYARFVEYGHRIVRNGITYGYKNGVFMMTLSEAKIRSMADPIIKASWERIIKEYGL